MSWETVSAILLFLLGLGLIIKGGDVFVDAATWMAEASGIPKFIVGATVVSIATTLPEVFASSIAAAGGSTEIAVGNAIGSVTANTGLIMGVSVIFLPMAIKRAQIGMKSAMMLMSIFTLLMVCLDGAVTIWDSILLFALFVAFIVENVYSASKQKEKDERPQVTKKILLINLLKFVLGAAALAIGSNLLVDNGKYLAKLIGVPERIIAITLIAIGTSLPELVTAITSLVKKQGSMSVGNIIGANIIDITMILPICSFISGGTLTVPSASIALDMPVCLAIAAIALLPTLLFKKFHRVQGVIMVGGYVAYLIYSVLM
ncbi:MAG: calcium/sodium antiporter [Faecousia sp.]|nr:calcium/sodium antiporter [Bacillota bacterium]